MSVICLQDVFKNFLKRIAKTIIYRKIWVGYIPEKIMVRVQIFQDGTRWMYRNF